MKKALKYWFSEEKGEVYCLFEASSAEAAEAPLFTEMPRRVLLGNRASGKFSSRKLGSEGMDWYVRGA